MPAAAPPQYTDAQLHALACIVCGTNDVDLFPADYEYTEDSEGGLLGWPVVACLEHKDRSSWLHNEFTIWAAGATTILLAVGHDWDAVRTPEALALPVVQQLMARESDQRRLGPILHCRNTHRVYFLVRTGSDSRYPKDCRLMTEGSWVAAPRRRRLPADSVRWLHLPEPGLLSSAAWIATALNNPPSTLGS
jgi:hypothetical protein